MKYNYLTRMVMLQIIARQMTNVSNVLGFDQNTLLTSFWSLHGLITPRLQYANEIQKQVEEK